MTLWFVFVCHQVLIMRKKEDDAWNVLEYEVTFLPHLPLSSAESRH